jgi:hypothetical protein
VDSGVGVGDPRNVAVAASEGLPKWKPARTKHELHSSDTYKTSGKYWDLFVVKFITTKSAKHVLLKGILSQRQTRKSELAAEFCPKMVQ